MPEKLYPRGIIANFSTKLEKEFLSRIEKKEKWERAEIAFEFHDAEFIVLADALKMNADSDLRP